MDAELISLIAVVAVAVVSFLYMKMTGKQLPPAIRAALPAVVRTLLGALSKTPGARNLCFVKAASTPVPLGPPIYTGTITGAEIMALRQPLGIKMYGPVDSEYELTDISEIERFLAWYRSDLPYTADDFDCDDHAWLMRAEALKWSKGKLAFGYVEGQSSPGSAVEFGPHAFNFVVTRLAATESSYAVWYVDELNVAGGQNKPVPAYPILSYMGRI